MNTHIDFDRAKLLKEKRFDEITNTIYMTNHTTEVLFENINRLKHSDGNNPFISAPTIAEVVMWLYEKHGIWIGVNSNTDGKFWLYMWKNGKTFIPDYKSSIQNAEFNSPTEAYQEAIKYCLNKVT